jgi:hypothetical protein
MAKAKRLNTTVHIGDSETGATRVVGPNDKLSAADRRELEKRWGSRSSEFLVDSDDDEVDDGSDALGNAQDALDSSHPHEDTALPADEKAEGTKSAMDKNAAVRTKATGDSK